MPPKPKAKRSPEKGRSKPAAKRGKAKPPGSSSQPPPKPAAKRGRGGSSPQLRPQSPRAGKAEKRPRSKSPAAEAPAAKRRRAPGSSPQIRPQRPPADPPRKRLRASPKADAPLAKRGRGGSSEAQPPRAPGRSRSPAAKRGPPGTSPQLRPQPPPAGKAERGTRSKSPAGTSPKLRPQPPPGGRSEKGRRSKSPKAQSPPPEKRILQSVTPASPERHVPTEEEIKVRRWYGGSYFYIKDVPRDGDCFYTCVGMVSAHTAHQRKPAVLRRGVKQQRAALADAMGDLEFALAYDPARRQTRQTGKFTDLAGLKACTRLMGSAGGRWADNVEILWVAQQHQLRIIISELLEAGKATVEIVTPTRLHVAGKSRLTKIGSIRGSQRSGARVELFSEDGAESLGHWRIERADGECMLIPEHPDHGESLKGGEGEKRRVKWERVQHLKIEGAFGDPNPVTVLLLRADAHFKLISIGKGRKFAARWNEVPQGVRLLETH
eukprot:Hpha_TRINITY_DN14552_c0_g2::TRINITY_DN14552_c0_g2_i1::g.46569::m.46569